MINSHKLEEHLVNYWSLVSGLVVAGLICGAAYYGYDYYNQKQELKAQEELYKADKEIQKFKQEDQKKVADFEAEQSKKLKADKNGIKAQKRPAPPKKEDHDYTAAFEIYRKVIRDFPKSDAARDAAIRSSDLYLEKKQYEQALAQLGVVDYKVSENKALQHDDLLSGLMRLKIASILEVVGKCQSEEVLRPIIESKKLEYLKPEALLRVALCSEQHGKPDQAKQYYQKVMQEFPETPASRDAEKYLRYLEVKTTDTKTHG